MKASVAIAAGLLVATFAPTAMPDTGIRAVLTPETQTAYRRIGADAAKPCFDVRLFDGSGRQTGAGGFLTVTWPDGTRHEEQFGVDSYGSGYEGDTFYSAPPCLEIPGLGRATISPSVLFGQFPDDVVPLPGNTIAIDILQEAVRPPFKPPPFISPFSVGIAATAIPTSLVAGETATYTFTVTNTGSNTLDQVQTTVRSQPSAELLPDSTASQGACLARAGWLCELGPLAPGAKATVTTVVRVESPGVATYRGDVQAWGTPGSVATSAGNSAVASVTAAQPVADLGVGLAAPAGLVAGGSSVMTATVANVGPNAARAVLVVTLPAGMSLATASPPVGCTGSPLVCTLGPLGVSARETVSLALRSGRVGPVQIVAQSSAAPPAVDPVPANDLAKTIVTVRLPPPVRGSTVNVVRERPIVLLNGRTLTAPAQAAVGSTLNTTRGIVRLSGANGPALVSNGAFRVTEGAARAAPTVLTLTGGTFGPCRPAAKVVRTLTVNGGANFRAVLRYATATTIGAAVLVGSDRCDGSLVRVLRGRATVYDAIRRTRSVVRAGTSVLIAPRR